MDTRGQNHTAEPEAIVNESHYHSKKDRIFVRAIQGHYNLKEELARVTLRDVPDRPGIAARVFHTLAVNNVVVDDIIQTVTDKKGATISFTLELSDLPDARDVIAKLCKRLKCQAIFEDHLAKVSVVGVGMRTHTGVAERMFAALAATHINIQNITTSEIKISCLVDAKQGKQALRVVHDAFDLGGRRTKPRKKGT